MTDHDHETGSHHDGCGCGNAKPETEASDQAAGCCGGNAKPEAEARDHGGGCCGGKPALSSAIDPVCGMTVDPAKTAHSHVHDGTTYYFCCGGCRTKFAADPARYLAKSDVTKTATAEGSCCGGADPKAETSCCGGQKHEQCGFSRRASPTSPSCPSKQQPKCSPI